ncbi:chromate transporter [Cytobacillus horneckiae]|uniref:Chromate transporter n=1 Tax=Cytobacillus horneckiae TaxID=549687 RepID=A0A2N0ZKW5_9BACI|nr:chromate transporter [Cytobacillus horneckiae]MEC1156321.1 chromate transporter [Cytobacillus horneckiae]MED2938339.1 chromate transporter [Cytobacillus horneckiae]PKG30147.1 chromate transporter [Cytobacillus horneckiae]
MNDQLKMLFQIFWTFFKIGPVTFGGGYAMIPLIEKEIVEKREWLKIDDVTDIFALAQSVPGAIALNASIFIGHRISGVKGSIAAMLGILLPTFIIVLSLGMLYMLIKDHPMVEAAFTSVRTTILALIVYAAKKIGKTAIFDKSTLCIVVAGVPILFFIHPIFVILIGMLMGVIIVWIKRKLGYFTILDRQHKEADGGSKDCSLSVEPLEKGG